MTKHPRKQKTENRSDGPEADRALIERCLSGDSSAWSELYRQCHDRLLVAIRRLLRNSQPDESFVEEIAARVWFSAVKKDGALLRSFDPLHNCRLVTYLSLVARYEAAAYLRSERRLRQRETLASELLPREQPPETISLVDFQEQFLANLTPREREFLDQELLGEVGSELFSPANSWQLRHRVHAKLAEFLQT